MARMFTSMAWGFIAGAGMSAALDLCPAFGLIAAGVCGLFASLASGTLKPEAGDQ